MRFRHLMIQHHRRWAPLLLAATAAASILLVTSASAAAPPNARYRGTQSNGDLIELNTGSDGASFEQISVARSGLGACTGTPTLPNAGTISAANSFVAASTAPTGGANSGLVGGVVGDAGAIAGNSDWTYGASSPNCAVRATYLAVLTQGGNAEGPGIPALNVWRGSASAGASLTVGGGVEIWTGFAPNVINSLSIDYKSGACFYLIELENIPLISRKMFETELATAPGPASAPSVSGVTQGSNRLGGGFSAPASGDCPAVSGMWTATLVPGQHIATPAPPVGAGPTATTTPATATPTGPRATATPAPTAVPASAQVRGAGTVSVRIPATGIGLTVFAGGTNEQLASGSGCASIASAAFWAGDGAGGFLTYVPGTSVAAVSAAWNARFSTGIPANTPIIGRCT